MRTNPITILYFFDTASWLGFARQEGYLRIDLVLLWHLVYLIVGKLCRGRPNPFKSLRFAKSTIWCVFISPQITFLVVIGSWHVTAYKLDRIFFPITTLQVVLACILDSLLLYAFIGGALLRRIFYCYFITWPYFQTLFYVAFDCI